MTCTLHDLMLTLYFYPDLPPTARWKVWHCQTLYDSPTIRYNCDYRTKNVITLHDFLYTLPDIQSDIIPISWSRGIGSKYRVVWGRLNSGHVCHIPQHASSPVHVSDSGALSTGDRCSVTRLAGEVDVLPGRCTCFHRFPCSAKSFRN